MQRGNGRDDDGRGLVDGMQKRRFGMVEILEMKILQQSKRFPVSAE
jgi:hypothetical protein